MRLQMPLCLLAHLRFEEFPHGPDSLRGERRAHAGDQRAVSGEQPRLQERRHDAHVRDTFLRALLDSAHTVAHLQTDVPQEGDQPLDRGTARGIRRLWNQQQDVDIGTGVQLPAAVAPDGHQRPIIELCQRLGSPGLPQNCIDECRACVDQVLDRFLGEESGLQLLMRLPEQVTVGRRRVFGFQQQARQSVQQRPGGAARRRGQRFLDQLRIACCHFIVVVRRRPR